MHLAILAAVVLAQVPLPVPYPGGAQDDYQSPIVSLIAWDKGGSQDWGAGIRAPDVDCAAVGTSASASLQCSGATPTFAGTGQVAAGSPWWYRGDTAVRPAIALNGSTDWWDLGDVGDATGSFAAFAAFRADTLTGDQIIVAKDVGGGRQFLFYRSSSVLAAVVCKTGGTCSTHTVGTLVAGSWYSAAFAYVYVADGTSIIRSNLNGVAPGELTTAVGPPVNVSTALRIGAYGDGTLKWAGSIRRVALWTGADAPTSAAQLAQLVATQWGLAADKPSGTVAAHARTDSTLCCPFSDAECYWVGPGAPCVHAPTYAGWASGGTVAGGIEVYRAGANALTYSETFANAAWVKSAGVSASDASASCPLGPTGVRMSLVTTDGEADQIAQDAATTPGRSVWMARATGDAACGITFADADGTGAQSVALTDGPLRYWSGGTGQTGLSVARPAGGCARWCMWAAQAQAVTYPVPYRTVAAGTPYSGAASTAATVTVPVALTDPARWAIAWTGTHGTWATSGAQLWGMGTAGQANSARVGLYGSVLTLYVNQTAVLYRGWNYTHGYSPGSQHTSLWEYPFAAWSDGARATLGDSGGTGGAMTAMPATLYVGQDSSGSRIDGLVSRVAQCRKAGGCR